MQTSVIFKILGLLLMIFSFSMLPPIAINWYYADGLNYPFMLAFAITFATGLICWFPLKNRHAELKIRDGFVIVVLFWIIWNNYPSIKFLGLIIMIRKNSKNTRKNGIKNISLYKWLIYYIEGWRKGVSAFF